MSQTTVKTKVVNFPKSGVVAEEFASISDFFESAKQRGNSPQQRNEHTSTSTGNANWIGTQTWGDAENLFMNGWNEPLDEMRKQFARKQRVRSIESKQRVIPRNEVAGYMPNVARYVMGLPDSMVAAKRIPMKQKTLHIMYDVAVNGDISIDCFRKAGVTVLDMIATIERQGFRVKLSVGDVAVWGPKAFAGLFVLKDYRDALDIKKLCFPLAHMAMERRVCFRFCETSPHVPGGGYGGAMYSSSKVTAFREELREQNAFYISVVDVRRAGYDADKLMVEQGIAQ